LAEIKDKKKFHIFSAAYTGSAVKKGAFGGKKEIAFIGRSNVGKSSLINGLCGQKKLAHVSRQPGKTRTINYYSIQSRREGAEGEERQEWYLVDLPGYGFAKTGAEKREEWGAFIHEYIAGSKDLALVGLLIDLRHPGLPIDTKAFEWLSEIAPEIIVIGTKADKLGKNEINKNLHQLARLFPTDHAPVAWSAQTGAGKADLLKLIEVKICEDG